MPARDRLSLQLYSLRRGPPLEQQLSMLAAAGYRNVEPFGGLYGSLGTLAKGLADNGLTARSGHFDLATLEREPDRAIDIAHRLGLDTLVVAYVQPEDRPSERRGWQAMGQRLGEIAHAFRPANLGIAFHNHDFEFHPLPDGSVPIEHLLVEGVLWEADLAWIVKAGADPKRWLARFAGRVPLVHVKDIAPAGENEDEDGWADVGDGTMDWASLWHAGRVAGAEIMVAEHDNPRDGERFARRSFAAMTRFDAESP